MDRLERKAREGTQSGREGEGRTGKNPVASNERILHFPRTEFIHSAEKLRLLLFLSSVVGCRSLALVRSLLFDSRDFGREGDRDRRRRRHASESCPAAGMIASTLKRRSQTTQHSSSLNLSLIFSCSLQVHPHFFFFFFFTLGQNRFCLYTYGRKLGRRLGAE